MPTLKKVPTRKSSVGESLSNGETANPSEYQWMAKEFRGDCDVSANDSTLSSTFLETALERMRRHEAIMRTQDARGNEHGQENDSPEASIANDSTMSTSDLEENLVGIEQKNASPKHQSTMNRESIGLFSPLKEAKEQGACLDINCGSRGPKTSSTDIISSLESRKASGKASGSQKISNEKKSDISSSDQSEYHTPDENTNLSATLSESEIISNLQLNPSKLSNDKSIGMNCDIVDSSNDHNQIEEFKRSPLLTSQLQQEKAQPDKDVLKTCKRSINSLKIKKITKEREVGPKEKEYLSKYKKFVDERIEEYRLKHPGKLPEYLKMDFEQKQLEHQRVMELLQRLGITSNKENADMNSIVDYSLHNRTCQSTSLLESTTNTPHRNETRKGESVVEDQSIVITSPSTEENQGEESMVLLSPDGPVSPSLNNYQHQPATSTRQDGDSKVILSPNAKSNDNHIDSNQDNSIPLTDSIEVTRADRCYESPENVQHHKKRLATTSGKRGSDLARARLADGSFESIDAITPRGRMDSPSKELEQSIGRLSLQARNVFSSSQSPIPRYSLSSSGSPAGLLSPMGVKMPDISFEGGASTSSDTSSRCDSVEETMMLQDKRVRWDFDGKYTKEAPTDVRLKEGETFHLQPLQTERHRKIHSASTTLSFPDPLGFYPERIQRRLVRLYRWLLRKEKKSAGSDADSKALILSLTEQQVVDLVLRLLLETTLPIETQSQNAQSQCAAVLEGNTLVVARSKEDLEVWSRSFREGSAFSVLNHATLPLKQRKTQSGADKCAKYDVVLTTYDALKSPDVTVTLDSKGYVISKRVGADNGWYTSKKAAESDEVDEYKQLSILHRVSWRRVVFADVIGRKSFLAKSGTSRATSATAINAGLRYAFMLSLNDKGNAVQAFLDSDRQALQSLSEILRLEGEGNRTSLENVLVDFKEKAKTSKKVNDN